MKSDFESLGWKSLRHDCKEKFFFSMEKCKIRLIASKHYQHCITITTTESKHNRILRTAFFSLWLISHWVLDERHRLFQHMQPKRQYNVGTQTVFQCFPMFSNVFNTKLGHRLCPNVFKTNNLYFPPQLLLQAEKTCEWQHFLLKLFLVV